MARATAPPTRPSRSDPDRPDGPGRSAGGPAWLSNGVQWVAGLALIAASLVFVLIHSEGMWFTSDMWDFLTEREIGSAEDVFGSRGANWATPTVVLIRVLYGLFEMDFWPWYFLPRLVGYALLILWLWRVMLRRGAHPLVALVALGLLAFFGPSAFLQGAFMGHAVSIALLMAAALLIHSTPQPTTRDQWVLFAFLVLGLMSNSPGVTMYAGVTAVLVVSLRIRHWWAPVLGAGVIYAIWSRLYLKESASNSFDLTFAEISQIPRLVLSILQGSMPRILEVGTDFGPVLAIGLVALLLWLASTGRLDTFDAIVLSAAGVYLTLVVIGRVLPDLGQATSARYAYLLALMLIPVLVPKIRVPDTRGAYSAVLAVGLLLVMGHAAALEVGLEFWGNAGSSTRTTVETAAALIDRGEPRIDRTLYHRFARALTSEGVERLLADGWEPEPSTDPALVEAARGTIRMSAFRGGQARNRPLLIDGPVRADGCVVIPAGETLSGEVVRKGSLLLRGPESTATVRWTDEFGVGTRIVDIAPRDTRLGFAEPLTTAEVEITAGTGRLVTCGVGSAEDG